VDGYYCAQDAPGFGAVSMAEYLGLDLRHFDSTEVGGASYLSHVGHAATAITEGKCRVALITLGGTPLTGGAAHGANRRGPEAPETAFETAYGQTTVAMYALAARRHMHEYGITSAEVARDLGRDTVRVLGQGEAVKHTSNGRIDLGYTAGVWSGPAAFAEAGLTPRDIDYASIYDSFTISVIEAVEDLGFCTKGDGGRFVESGALLAPFGALPFNTDGGGLCNNHPANRGGMTKVIEAVRQLRQEAAAPVQVPNCRFALVHGMGGLLGSRMATSTLILGRSDA